MARKTVELKSMIDIVNNRNRCSTCAPSVREGWNSILEEMLHSCGVYGGYGYLSADKVPPGERPGINAPPENFSVEERFANCDETRRQYYISSKLMSHS